MAFMYLVALGMSKISMFEMSTLPPDNLCQCQVHEMVYELSDMPVA